MEGNSDSGGVKTARTGQREQVVWELTTEVCVAYVVAFYATESVSLTSICCVLTAGDVGRRACRVGLPRLRRRRVHQGSPSMRCAGSTLCPRVPSRQSPKCPCLLKENSFQINLVAALLGYVVWRKAAVTKKPNLKTLADEPHIGVV